MRPLGGIEVYPINAKVYQSVLQKSIDIIGKGFKTGIAFTFEPDLKVRTYALCILHLISSLIITWGRSTVHRTSSP